MSSARRGLFLLTFCTIYLLLAPIAYDAASRWLLTTERNTKSDCWPDIYSTSLFSNHRHFLNGWFWAAVLFPLAERFEKILWRSFFADGDDELYGLHHAILNVEVPPKSMWMNMGYWEHAKTFPEACTSLLQKVLQTAGLLDEDGKPRIFQGSASIKLVDVGFGCGDQTLYLTRQLSRVDDRDRQRPLFDNYVGITINRHQAEFARQRLSENTAETETWTPNVRIFCADAANPTSWSSELRDVVSRPVSENESSKESTWLLALDTLYHFKPSRQPLFNYAYEHLHASIMAFDLILSDSASMIDRILLRLVCLLASTPFSNFKTHSEYRQMLITAGYSSDSIEMQDISEYVFSGIAGYIERREAELKRFGMGLGKLRQAGKVFGWWGRSGVSYGTWRYGIIATLQNKV
ncbi:hypothetical protein T310_2635 [Rasamsonia emersonii CBS 393.64]|uniref:S-adenosyl-L-methionine-dependent methyltransferase n=1 Tax=Rasamsonia emersonii (strain ATCC 16479 / CBS 393.64 / IMI 116815) TaxID=1408163 RepID=A0A0F4YZ12_RASE3|nr:hypothetical protein T310_2635 [Rasamsonia emersonii CBS 393.64]KKA23325.1 hypothetical protein T310_2635 [Rasamsonia emersonii CBS 393.64]